MAGEVSTIAALGNPVTKTMARFEPAYRYEGEERGDWFIAGFRMWCEVMWGLGRYDPVEVDTDKLIEWYAARLSHASTKFSVIDVMRKGDIIVGGAGRSLREAPKTRPEDQALPTTGREPVQDRLTEFVGMVRERRELGVKRYGRPLETGNGRDAGRDLVEELVDAACYAMQLRLERRDGDAELSRLRHRVVELSDDLSRLHQAATRAIDHLATHGANAEDVREARRILNGKREEENQT